MARAPSQLHGARVATATALVAGLLLAACTAGPSVQSPSHATASPTATPAPTDSAQPSATAAVPSASAGSPSPMPNPTPADLSARPLSWFAPLPPMPGRTGSADFMAQFEPAAPWAGAAQRIGVYKLYGEWVAYHATDAQLRQAVADINRRGLILAVEAGALEPPADCGRDVEGFAGVQEGRLIAQRILAAGGRIAVIALDEPYYYAHVYDGPNACHWDLQRIARGVADYVREMRRIFPELIVGDTEPLPLPVSATGLADWLTTYEAVAGEPFAFLHLDMDWSRTEWPALAHETGRLARERGVPIGMIYNGGSAPTREAWIRLAGQRVLEFEADGPEPEHVLFQSWMLQPDRVLPDDDPTTFSGLVGRYFSDHAGLADPFTGSGANLAFGADARASESLAGSRPRAATDGDYDTLWNAGAGPRQWIEVTLEEARAVGSVRLTVSQYPAGETDHRLLGRTVGGRLVLLHRFTGPTSDGMLLEVSADASWPELVGVRIETRSSPSWVAWREIEVLAP